MKKMQKLSFFGVCFTETVQKFWFLLLNHRGEDYQGWKTFYDNVSDSNSIFHTHSANSHIYSITIKVKRQLHSVM